MIRSIQLPIIQAFTAPWEINFEEMVVILKFHQKMEKNDNIHHIFIKSIWKSWLANVQYTQLVFHKAIEVWRSFIILCFSINHDFKLFLIYWMEWLIICLSWFNDGFDTYMMNIIIVIHLLMKIQNDHHFLKFYLSWSCKSLNNR